MFLGINVEAHAAHCRMASIVIIYQSLYRSFSRKISCYYVLIADLVTGLYYCLLVRRKDRRRFTLRPGYNRFSENSCFFNRLKKKQFHPLFCFFVNNNTRYYCSNASSLPGFHFSRLIKRIKVPNAPRRRYHILAPSNSNGEQRFIIFWVGTSEFGTQYE